ncbi:MAG: hypothetical protein EP318_06075 [Rhodobacteraceae bacterium]|nr:MAG: hypothetical protein EP318_06075 [Paracoccaceae bacterium]
MSWSLADPIRRAEVAARGLNHTERLAVAWRLVEGVDDPEDFRQLDMFLGMLSAHCDEVRLDAALANMVETPAGSCPVREGFLRTEAPEGADTSLQATTTHEQNTPVPGPGPRRLRAALARAGDALSRSDETWAGSIVGALCFAAAAAIGIISAGVLS